MQACAVVESDGTVKASGVIDPVPWWSFTKTALAIALLHLAETGHVALDETVDDAPYTARQLLRHESGLPDYGSLADYHADVAAGRPPWPLDRLLAETEATRLRFNPGEGWAYSNIGYLMVAQLLTQASGLDLVEALETLVFSPAGVTTARLVKEPGDLAGVQMGDVTGYHPAGSITGWWWARPRTPGASCSPSLLGGFCSLKHSAR
jgi:CubicO group peptidase (beta-lactamase class C family)